MKLNSVVGIENTGGYVEIELLPDCRYTPRFTIFCSHATTTTTKDLNRTLEELDSLIDILVDLRANKQDWLLKGWGNIT